ncbi:MAG: hypothetical protein MJ131_10010 [Lachnospiraceae bacterium]|nr:hypothetical protein [Lachnospiraceae bacterium]
MKKRLLVLATALVMSLGLAACSSSSNSGATVTATPTPGAAASVTATPTPAPEVEPEVIVVTEAPKEVVAVSTQEASIDFEDGNTGFVTLYAGDPRSDASTMELTDFNGSKALAVTKEKIKNYSIVAIDALSLLGDKASDVAVVQFDAGSYHAEGFFAMSGDAGFWSNGEYVSGGNWNVYLETSNPKTITIPMAELKFSEETPVFMIRVKDDGCLSNTTMLAEIGTAMIDNIRFLDAAGNTISVDTTVEFAEYDGLSATEADMSNLYTLTDVVEFEGFTTGAGAWAQQGFVIPQEVWDALEPGSIIEADFNSETGCMWFVFPNAEAGWSRVGNGANQDGSGLYINDSRTKAQLKYEDIVAVCGEDKSTWGLADGVVLQGESSGAWEIYSVRVGKAANVGTFEETVEFPDFVISGKAWGQDGFQIPAEVLDALVPGTALEISYASESGILWAVFPDAACGWTRVGRCDGDMSCTDPAVCVGGKCYITYEQLVAALGEDKAAWGSEESLRLQCESSSAWEVYGVKVGTYANAPKLRAVKTFDEFVVSGKAWGQDGAAVSDELKACLVPGSVLKISFSSPTGLLWTVFPDSAAGWQRVGRCDADKSATDPAKCVAGNCYVTYDQIVAVLGDDVDAWGNPDSFRIQFESNDAWEVYSLSVGQE